jgi:protease I
METQSRRVAILIESDYFEPEIFYYRHRFAEEGYDVHFMSRLWGQASQVFTGHEFGAPFTCEESFEDVSAQQARDFAAVIVPSGMVADRLRFTEDPARLPPATSFLATMFREPSVVKGIICHGMWLAAPMPELVAGRRVTAHNNLLGDLRNMGADYVDEDVVVDGDLVTARTGEHCHLFARTLIELLSQRAADLAGPGGQPGSEIPRGEHAA